MSTELNIQIYSQPGCGACEAAKMLLKSKNIPYQELILNLGQKQEEGKTYVPVEHLKARFPEARTMPQIFNGRKHIGGMPELNKFIAQLNLT